MTRPSISLAMIVKNEAHNLPALFKSIENCFDEIHITDTGSTDETVDIAKQMGARVHYFEWVNDFAAARNASLEPIKTDYVMWLDGDDVLSDKDAFIRWRDYAMTQSDFWLATYHYAFHKNGVPSCSFVRERVFRANIGLKFKYFVHEGVPPIRPDGRRVEVNTCTTWTINHMRSDDDIKADKARNLKLFEGRDDIDARMQYYWGKELFENNEPKKAIEKFKVALADSKLELHDKILAIQYMCLSLMRVGVEEKKVEVFPKVIEFAQQGLMLAPHRAEFYTFIGDSYIKMNRLHEAIPSFSAAKACRFTSLSETGIASPIFSYEDCYGAYPRKMLAKLYAKEGNLDLAHQNVNEVLSVSPDHEEAKLIKSELEKLEVKVAKKTKTQLEDAIVFTTPEMNLYQWDWETYKKKGIGGSETACVEIAYWLKRLTNKRVIVFNTREKEDVQEGVEYFPLNRVHEYFEKYEPSLHIAWRHPIDLTKAPTYVWSHDLVVPQIENRNHYEKVHRTVCDNDFLILLHRSCPWTPMPPRWANSSSAFSVAVPIRPTRYGSWIIFAGSVMRSRPRLG